MWSESTHPARPRRSSAVAVSIHAPRAGCDSGHVHRGATVLVSIHARLKGTVSTISGFNPRTPRGVRLIRTVHQRIRFRVSIHAPPERWPGRPACFNPRTPLYSADELLEKFQSTHPARGATGDAGIHRLDGPGFNPRTPRGVRRSACSLRFLASLFQSTHPARGATTTGWDPVLKKMVSIHAPRAGCDEVRRASLL